MVALLPLLLLGAIGSVQTYLFVSAQAQATQSELASRVGREVQQHIAGLVADIELFALASDLTRQDARHQQAALATLLAALSAAEKNQCGTCVTEQAQAFHATPCLTAIRSRTTSGTPCSLRRAPHDRHKSVASVLPIGKVNLGCRWPFRSST